MSVYLLVSTLVGVQCIVVYVCEFINIMYLINMLLCLFACLCRCRHMCFLWVFLMFINFVRTHIYNSLRLCNIVGSFVKS